MVFKVFISPYWYHIVTSKYNLCILYSPFVTKDRLSSRHLSLYHIHSHIYRYSFCLENNTVELQSNIFFCKWRGNLQTILPLRFLHWMRGWHHFASYAKSVWAVFWILDYPSSASVSTICIWLLIFATTYLFMRLYRISSSDWFPWLTWEKIGNRIET